MLFGDTEQPSHEPQGDHAVQRQAAVPKRMNDTPMFMSSKDTACDTLQGGPSGLQVSQRFPRGYAHRGRLRNPPIPISWVSRANNSFDLYHQATRIHDRIRRCPEAQGQPCSHSLRVISALQVFLSWRPNLPPQPDHQTGSFQYLTSVAAKSAPNKTWAAVLTGFQPS